MLAPVAVTQTTSSTALPWATFNTFPAVFCALSRTRSAVFISSTNRPNPSAVAFQISVFVLCFVVAGCALGCGSLTAPTADAGMLCETHRPYVSLQACSRTKNYADRLFAETRKPSFFRRNDTSSAATWPYLVPAAGSPLPLAPTLISNPDELGSMRVEVRCRPSPAGGVPTPKRSANANPGLVKAYSDSCFESPTAFYIASPEHPKLGKWAKPSTLKYSQIPPQRDFTTTQCLDEALLFASNSRGNNISNSRPRTAGCSSRPVGHGGCHRTSRGKSSFGTTPPYSSGAKASRPAEGLTRTQRPISPVGTSSSIQGQREAPRIDTPISGRVRGDYFLSCSAASA